ncbi:hypothetical protein TA3x_000111 [Tundrisphaera sp. TA3]|uniref:hypothetical protein n=1 Tax=Tundrisphaera sp. TA3 TaxID=3435775 RepID=UPI003EC11B6D
MSDKRWSRLARVVLILTSLVFGLVLIPAGLVAPFSLMAFDQGISLPGVAFASAFLTFPLVILASIPASWIFHRRHADRAAILVGLLPTVNVLVVAALFLALG